MKQDKNEVAAFLAGVLFGGLLGAALALILGPTMHNAVDGGAGSQALNGDLAARFERQAKNVVPDSPVATAYDDTRIVLADGKRWRNGSGDAPDSTT